MKNILAENLLRFGVKNLKETEKKVLSESLLLEQTQQTTAAIDALNTALKEKPTKVGGVDVYPQVSVKFTGNVLPQKGQPLGALGKELGSWTGIGEAYKYNGNLAAGSKVPFSLSISMAIPLLQSIKEKNATYYNFLSDLKMRQTKTWRFPYGSTAGSQATMFESNKVSEVKITITNYLNNYYVTDGSSWFGVKNVDASASGTSQDFNTQLTTLLNNIASYPGFPYRPISV